MEKETKEGQTVKPKARHKQVLSKWQTMPQGIGAISAQLIDLRHFLSLLLRVSLYTEKKNYYYYYFHKILIFLLYFNLLYF